MSWYVGVLKKYAVFCGRARRKAYWMFFLFNVMISFILGLVDGLINLALENDQNILANLGSANKRWVNLRGAAGPDVAASSAPSRH